MVRCQQQQAECQGSRWCPARHRHGGLGRPVACEQRGQAGDDTQGGSRASYDGVEGLAHGPMRVHSAAKVGFVRGMTMRVLFFLSMLRGEANAGNAYDVGTRDYDVVKIKSKKTKNLCGRG